MPRLAGERTGALGQRQAGDRRLFADQDLLGQWLDEACDTEPGNRHKHEPTVDLFASWTEFAKQAGDEPGSRKAFSSELGKRGFEPFREGHDNIRSFRGLRLKLS